MSYVSFILPQIPTLFLLLTAGHLLYNKYGRGLNSIPGPWLASFSHLWRLFLARTRRFEAAHIKLHQQYGGVVRLGPNMVSITDWEAIKKIYAPNSGYVKSEFYPVQQVLAHGKRLQSLFNTTDEKHHAKLRRAIANAFSMSNVTQFEPLVDSTIATFTTAMEERFVNRKTCDFGEWLHFFAFDVLGELTFSKRLGFVEQGIDVERIMRSLEDFMAYWVVVSHLISNCNCHLKLMNHSDWPNALARSRLEEKSHPDLARLTRLPPRCDIAGNHLRRQEEGRTERIVDSRKRHPLCGFA